MTEVTWHNEHLPWELILTTLGFYFIFFYFLFLGANNFIFFTNTPKNHAMLPKNMERFTNLRVILAQGPC